MKKLAELKLGIKLSVSLHTPDDALRTRIMPINKKYPLRDVIRAAKLFSKKEKCPVTFEYALISGVNTGKKDAGALAKLLRGLRYKINLIPLNDYCGSFSSPSRDEIDRFKGELENKGIFFTLRKPRGSDISAACGQLRAKQGLSFS
jgi:23S rRNA (adenine2503-C2)-methyltransferase